MMEKQYEYAGIWIELTRRCNLQCAHCSCGESQNVDISTEIIDRIFVDVKDCGRIVLTGGEPLLRLDMIEYLIDKIGEYRWHTDYLELTTNGLIQDTRIVNLLSRFCGFRKGNRAYLRVSTDEFHDIVASAKALSFYWDLCRDIPNITVIPSDKLSVILLRGRAKKLIETHPELAERYFINALDCSLMAQPDCASDCSISVSKSHTEILIAEVLKLLKTQGVCCTTCPRFQYRLYPLSDCAGVLWEHETEDLRLGLMLSCGSTQTRYFELTIRQKGADDDGEE